jgi:hypothetical protein
MALSLINALRLDSKTESESTNSDGYRQSSKIVYRVPYLSESPGGVVYLVGNEKSFCRGQVEDDQCLVK